MENEVVVRITDLSRGGAGVAREDSGRVVFVPYSAPGDRVRIRIHQADKRYAQGEILEILEPSPLRQIPPCSVFGRCGGCQWQHLPYSLQWDTKSQGILHALKRIQVPIPEIFDQLPAERIWEYRNRVQLRGLGTQLGFYESGSQRLVPVERCEIARPEINQEWKTIRSEAARFSQPFKVEIEVLPSGVVQKSWNARHSASGFRQIHDDQNEKLKNWIYQAFTPSDILYDLFGGAGNLSTLLTDKMNEIHCVDVSVPKIRPQGLPSYFHFHKASVVSWLLKRASDQRVNGVKPREKKVAALLDPPREGLGRDFTDIAQSLEDLGTREIVAVGCDPDAWARDVSRWVKRGWVLKKVMAIDLFPQTHHIEAAGFLGL